MGRHHELLDEVTDLAEAHPLRERLTAQLMMALYRSGQAAAALTAFQRARCHLAEELGIDPGAELRQLEMAILRGDSRMAPPRPARASAHLPGSRGIRSGSERGGRRDVPNAGP